MSGMTNAQAALQAAATMYTGTDIHPDTVSGAAGVYKRWLDKQDREDGQRWVRPADASSPKGMPAAPRPAGVVLPGPKPQARPLPSSAGHPDTLQRCAVSMCALPKGHPGTDHPSEEESKWLESLWKS